jgi:hypothetical protein
MYKNSTLHHYANVNFPTLSSGHYTATGNNYYQHSETGQLIKVCTRTKNLGGKPPQYLMLHPSGRKPLFFSSLYGNGATYTAENSRIYYTITITGETLNVVRKENC